MRKTLMISMIAVLFLWLPAACKSVVAPDSTAVAPDSSTAVVSESMTADIILTAADGVGESVGILTLEDTDYGLLLTPNLASLSPGLHGFHVHANPDCGPAAKEGQPVPGLAAGGHFDPNNIGEHKGPYRDGHLGDLPPLYVDASGRANVPVLAPRLTVSQTRNHSLMIHAGGDNFSDQPSPLGGGGARAACGVLGA